MRRRLLLRLGIAATLSTAALQAADTIAYTISAGAQNFGTVDLNTGVFTKIGGVLNTTGFGVAGGALYGIFGGFIYQINLSTGGITLAANPSLGNNLQGFGSTSAGLFLIDGFGDLVSVDPTTGLPTLVGSTGVTGGLGAGVLSTSTDSATLFWVNNGAAGPKLYNLNTSTGVATLIGPTGNGAGSGVVQSMLFQGGTLWASLGFNTGAQFGTVNTSTGAETLVTSAAVGNVFALAPFPLPVVPQPAVLSGGVVPVYSSSTTIQPGEWISIFGTGLAGGSATWTGNFPTALGNTSVTINGKPAYIWFVNPTQINLQAPDDTATGSVPVVVTTPAGKVTSTVTLAQIAPSFLLLDSKHVTGIILRSDGSGAFGGGAYDIAGPTGTSLGYRTVAAKAGDSVVLFGVGFGPTTPAVPAGKAFSGAAPTTNAVTVLINNVSVTPSFAGLSSAGLYQINLTLPAGLSTGDVPLVATAGGASTQTGVVISLQ
jgi:uncharacterized protein (TIGR03437 family)